MKKTLIIVGLLAIAGLFFSCSEHVSDNPIGNQKPETKLFLEPTEGTQLRPQSSRLTVHWWGDDPDGLVVGYYFKWVGINDDWQFASKNDSTFNLPVQTTDTTFTFRVKAVDNHGNGRYDTEVTREGVNYGAEPFTDKNNNGSWDEGEPYVDLGEFDDTPAELEFPLYNSIPEVSWKENFVLPDTTLPVITVAWNATDLDGEESIRSIDISANDTSDYVSLPGNTRLVTLRPKNLNDNNPEYEILLDGQPTEVFEETLTGLQFNSENKLYIRAMDIAGATSNIIEAPDTSFGWYINKPRGELLLIDDFMTTSDTEDKSINVFYKNAFSSIDGGNFQGKFELLDLEKTDLPYINLTLLETMKFFEYTYWYSSNEPDLSLIASIMTGENAQEFYNGKIAFSMTFAGGLDFTLADLQTFLPVDDVEMKNVTPVMFAGAEVNPVDENSGYPPLVTNGTVTSVRTFAPNTVRADSVYNLNSDPKNGNIAFINNEKTLFFIGLPLNYCNGGDKNVIPLLEKLYVEDFGMSQ